MKAARRGFSIFIIAVFAGVIITGCTPGRSNARNLTNKNSVKSEKIDEEHYSEEDFEVDEESADPSVGSGVDKAATEDDSAPLAKGKFYQKGIASWYGREFHGKETASGDRFDMNKLTAAHRALPFGTVVEVKNLDNGKSVRVTVNDRGPYKGNRIIDLSYGAAKRLDMIRGGKALVGITVLRKGNADYEERALKNQENVEPVSDDISDESEGIFALQAGAFYSRKNAEELKKRVEEITSRDAKLVRDGNLYKVRIEGIESKKEISRFKRLLTDENISSYMLEQK